MRGPGGAALSLALLLITLASSWAEAPATAEVPVIRSFSGTPLLLEITLPESFTYPCEVTLHTSAETGASAASYSFTLTEPPEEPDNALRIGLVPGVGSQSITLSAALQDGTTLGTWEYAVVVTPFVWGRDNFRFGNNADYESVIGDYSEVLSGWLEERFTVEDEGSHVLLTDLMYSLFGQNAGRCYAFTGSQLRYLLDPESLPPYYETVYAIRPGVSRLEREMHYLQFDIVYEELLPLGLETLESAQSAQELAAQLSRITRRIDRGVPAAVGFLGPELHHSMLVIGYIGYPSDGRVDLLVANNWKSREELNLRSRDAEIVEVRPGARSEEDRLLWRHSGGVRRRQPHRMLLVELPQDRPLDPALMEELLLRRAGELRMRSQAILLVENASNAWVERRGDSGRTGFYRGRTRSELGELSYDRVQRTHRFALPLSSEFILRAVDDDDRGMRIHLYRPGREGGDPQVTVVATSGPAESSVERSYRITEGGLEALEQ